MAARQARRREVARAAWALPRTLDTLEGDGRLHAAHDLPRRRLRHKEARSAHRPPSAVGRVTQLDVLGRLEGDGSVLIRQRLVRTGREDLRATLDTLDARAHLLHDAVVGRGEAVPTAALLHDVEGCRTATEPTRQE
jgi:hypothetical protein